ncbi:MAG: hypothetical protein OHM56_12355 [Spiroplasma phoeniceum]|nr:MAG: hypothetical protein OHM57_11790 [Spiroplasma phoeniceum]UZQ32303.1 MAG: hypothetical protein OHM56_12355 [Spiroplasma phoeniceum]
MQEVYYTEKSGAINFLLQTTKLSNNDNEKIKETYLQAYYTNDVKLKIRFSKVLFAQLWLLAQINLSYAGNNKNITININNQNVLDIRNDSDNPVKITINPR